MMTAKINELRAPIEQYYYIVIMGNQFYKICLIGYELHMMNIESIKINMELFRNLHIKQTTLSNICYYYYELKSGATPEKIL